MSDLISRKALMDVFQEKADDNTGLLRNNMLFAKELVKSIPTAYDVDGVVEKLEKEQEDAYYRACKSLSKEEGARANALLDAIEIVEGGGIA